MTAGVYAKISAEVRELVARHHELPHPTAAAYMVIRAALLEIRAREGEARAAEVAYRLGDEMVTGTNSG